tara:strand:+ start:780 stop:929 length:150 start_codon:yes stop_codon:yes gene_type:complete
MPQHFLLVYVLIRLLQDYVRLKRKKEKKRKGGKREREREREKMWGSEMC